MERRGPFIWLSSLALVSLLAISRTSARADGAPGLAARELHNLLGGPIESQNQQPLELMHRGFSPSSPYTLAPGSLLLSLDGTWANTLNRRRTSYLFDAETRYLRPALRFGVSDDLEIGFDQPLLWRGAGFTDSSIEGWHNLFGLPRGPRRFVPRDQFVLQGQTRNGETYRETRDGIGLADALVSGKLRLRESETSLLSMQLSASIPSGRESYGQDASDLTAALLGSVDLSDSFRLYAGGGFTYLLDPWQKELLFRRQQYRAFLGITYFLSERLAVYLGVNGGGALVENIQRFPDYQVYADVGFKHALGSRSFLSFLVRENPAPSESTTDIAAELGFSQLFF